MFDLPPPRHISTLRNGDPERAAPKGPLQARQTPFTFCRRSSRRPISRLSRMGSSSFLEAHLSHRILLLIIYFLTNALSGCVVPAAIVSGMRATRGLVSGRAGPARARRVAAP